MPVSVPLTALVQQFFKLRTFLIGWGMLLGLAWGSQAANPLESVCITEFLAVNQHGLRDEEGKRSGWIELYNGGHTAISLEGCYLTDNRTNLAQWRFPKVVLLSDTYMVVFASGKDRTNDLAHLHTRFQLNPQGGYLALVSPAKAMLSEFAGYPKQVSDVSYGRLRGELALCGAFLHPTPGKPNGYRGPEFAPEVTFSKSSGGFTLPFPLQLSCATPKTVIRYTLDGSLPTSAAPIYTAPLLITNSIQVRARVYQDGLLPGPPQSEAFLLLHTNVVEFTSTLPVIVIDTFGKELPALSHSMYANLLFYEPVNGKTSFTNPPALAIRGGFHGRGSSTRDMPKASFAVELLDEFNHEQHHAVLGLPSESDWVLYAVDNYEPVMIHNPFVHQLSRSMGRYSPRTRFVEVYLSRKNGPLTSTHYNGIYVLEEKIKVSKHRLVMDRVGPDDLKPPEVTGGYLLKVDRLGPDEAGLSAAGTTMAYIEPKERVINLPQRAPQKEYLKTYFTDFEHALHGPNWKDPIKGYRAFIDVDSWIDFHVLEVLSGNVDTLVLSTYFHKPRNGKLIFGPHWDFDRALGSTDGRDDNPRQWNTGPFFDAAWWNRLFSDPDFWQLWVDRWQELRQNLFSLDSLNALTDRLAGELREAQPRETKRWGVPLRGGSYQSEIDLMKRWLASRVDFIDQQLVQPPRFSQLGGKITPEFSLTIAGPTNATVYYTLDGSDPRLSQGGISSNAIAYTGPLQFKASTFVTARAHNPNQRQTGGPPTSTPWSSRVMAKFTVTKK
ncbi:MAG: CotH kinase family protein [Verrucomicrobiota bacterium]